MDIEDQLQLYVLTHGIHWKLFKLNWCYPGKINLGLLIHIQKQIVLYELKLKNLKVFSPDRHKSN